MTQHRFADELACSYSSVQGYEGGRNIPKAIVDRMVAIARDRHLPDLVDELHNWNAEPVNVRPSSWGYAARNRKLHDMLEAILESGDKRAADAIGANLPIFYAWVTERAPARSPRKSPPR